MPEFEEYNGAKKMKNMAVVAGAAVLAVFFCAFYLWILKDVIKVETEKYLTEISEKTVEIAKGDIDETFSDMELMARSVILLCDGPDAEKKVGDFIKNAESIYGYSRIGMMTEDGEGWISGGYEPDFGDEEFLKRAFDGEKTISDPRLSSIDGNEILIYAVPVRDETGAVSSVFLWSRSMETLHDRLNITTFYNEGHSHLVKQDGTFIFENEAETAEYRTIDRYLKEACTGTGQAQIASLMENLREGRKGFITYKKDETNYIGSYAPLGINGWFLLDVVSENTVNGAFNKAMRLGACIVAGFIVLCLFLVGYVSRLQEKHLAKLRNMAFNDPVTGGGNITYFREQARALIRKSPPGTYAMISLDINSFKLINVTFGQEAGDRTLKYIYQTLKDCLEPGEITARMSQDRFRMLWRNAPVEQLVKRLEDVVGRIERYNDSLERKYFLSFSAGIRVVDEPDDNIIIIGDQVNMARKKAKANPQNGPLSWAVYEAQDKTELMRGKEILDDMARAIKNHEFMVYLQPKIDLKTKHLAGAEALVRWILPDGTMMRPDEFIPVLERGGRISELDLYMFEEVCKILKSWEQRGFYAVPISVNFSRVNVLEDGILEKYQEIQKKTGVPSELLEIELTETMVQGNMEYFRQLFEDIHRLRYQCSLDDFGSGYSSLNILKDLPVDVIKLDRLFFLQDTGSEDREKEIVKGVIQIAKSLGIKTVAEGVEDGEQVKNLEAMGCDMVQGYYYSRPVPVAEFEEKYRKEFERT